MFNPISLIHQICKDQNISITKMEKDLGFFKGYLNSNRTTPISYERLEAISNYLGISVNVLETGNGYESPSKSQPFSSVKLIRDICAQRQIPISQIEKDLGFSNGYLNAKRTAPLPTDRILLIAKYLNVTPEYLMTGKDPKPKAENTTILSLEAHKIAKQYDDLDEYGKALVKDVVNHEVRRVQSASVPAAKDGKVIPLFANSFAAGTGEPDFGNMWTNYTVPVDSSAEFAIRINGNSMEPLLTDGSIALGVKREPRDGEVGAFLLNGEFLVKQYCSDHRGDVYLFSLNRDRADADRSLMVGEDSGTLYCFGTILVKRQPLPDDAF